MTLFNRGKRNPGLFPDIETVIGDRNESLDALKGRKWDVVVDNSAYFPAQVKKSTELLKDQVRHYIYVSSISAYADLTPPGIDEDYKLAQLKDPNVTEINNDTYGGLKAACEQIVEQAFGERQAVIRPSYIVGPGDTSDRFTYWPVRVARGGEVLAPGSPLDPIQFVDVRDLADFMRVCVERTVSGRYNLCNPPGAVTMGDLLETSKRLSKSNATFTLGKPVVSGAEQSAGERRDSDLGADRRRGSGRDAGQLGPSRGQGPAIPRPGYDDQGHARLARTASRRAKEQAARGAYDRTRERSC